MFACLPACAVGPQEAHTPTQLSAESSGGRARAHTHVSASALRALGPLICILIVSRDGRKMSGSLRDERRTAGGCLRPQGVHVHVTSAAEDRELTVGGDCTVRQVRTRGDTGLLWA